MDRIVAQVQMQRAASQLVVTAKIGSLAEGSRNTYKGYIKEYQEWCQETGQTDGETVHLCASAAPLTSYCDPAC